jgi:nucleotide-binding universal stress UspA family protein
MYQNILVATDGTQLGSQAVEHAAKLAHALNARLTIVTVTEPPPTFSSVEIGWTVPGDVYDQFRRADAERARKILQDALAATARLGSVGSPLHIPDQSPHAGILSAAKDTAADLIVISSHGHRGLDRLIMGSQASKILSLAQCPVLTVKQHSE